MRADGATSEPKSARLPPACGICAPYEGLWRIGAGGGLTRCGCARGVRLAEVAAKRGANTRRVGSKVRAFPAATDWKSAAAGPD